MYAALVAVKFLSVVGTAGARMTTWAAVRSHKLSYDLQMHYRNQRWS